MVHSAALRHRSPLPIGDAGTIHLVEKLDSRSSGIRIGSKVRIVGVEGMTGLTCEEHVVNTVAENLLELTIGFDTRQLPDYWRGGYIRLAAERRGIVEVHSVSKLLQHIASLILLINSAV